jgi:hypothetical protein
MFQYGDVSHVPSSFAICLFLALWDIYRRHPAKLAAFTVGLLGGLGKEKGGGISRPKN